MSGPRQNASGRRFLVILLPISALSPRPTPTPFARCKTGLSTYLFVKWPQIRFVRVKSTKARKHAGCRRHTLNWSKSTRTSTGHGWRGLSGWTSKTRARAHVHARAALISYLYRISFYVFFINFTGPLGQAREYKGCRRPGGFGPLFYWSSCRQFTEERIL